MFKTIGKDDLSPAERKRQHFFLDEFLKYSKLSNQLFMVTQGSSYDTSNFNNPYLLYKKQLQYEAAQKSVLSAVLPDGTMIPAVDALLDNTFIKQTKLSLESSRDVLVKVLLSDTPNVRKVIQKVLYPYRNKSDRDFVEVAKKAVTSLFDWSVQTTMKTNKVMVNNQIHDILVSSDNVSREMNAFVKEVKKDVDHDLIENEVIKLFEVVPSRSASEGGTDNIKIRTIGTEVYDQNKLIYAFRELKEYLGAEKKYLYDRLIMLSVLQSGLSSSVVSFTSSIPFEDFSAIYNEPMALLDGLPDIDTFKDLSAFERNNWHSSNIIPFRRAKFIKTSNGPLYNPSMEFLPKNIDRAVKSKKLPPIISLDVGFSTNNSDHVSFSWEKGKEMLTEDEVAYLNKNSIKLYTFLKEKKAAMKEAGDYSYINKALFEKVINPSTNKPLMHSYTPQYGPQDGSNTRYYYIYKAISAWGNGPFANEYYTVAKPSVINNGYMKIENEVDNSTVVGYFDPSSMNRKRGTAQVIAKEELLEDYSQQTGKVIGSKNPNSTMTLKGKTYKFSEIDGDLLLSLGYTDENQMGEILNKVCK